MTQHNPVRLGVIGFGNIARQHINHLLSGAVDDCRLAAVCSPRVKEASAELEVPCFASVEELISTQCCDAVLVATPTHTHLSLGLQCLQAGLHVLMEKPLGLSIGEAEQLLDQQQAGQVFALMLNQRTDPAYELMRDCIQSGQLGDITRTQWTMTNWFRPEVYFQVSDWRATWRGEGGGLLVNQCIHNLDIYQWLCGMPASLNAFCQFGRYHDIEVEDEATAYFTYANGASGVFIGSTGEAPGVNRLDIIGDSGSLCFDGQSITLTHNEPATSEYNRSTRDMFGMPACDTRDITPDRDVNQHARVISNFASAILYDEPLIAPATEGLNSLALANAMLLSTWEGGAIELPLDSSRYQQALDARIASSILRDKSDIEANVDMSASYR